MEWTEHDRKLAKELTQPDMLAFLERIFLDINTSFSQNFRNDVSLISQLTDKQYGQMMKVLMLTKKENSARIQQLKVIATKKDSADKPKPVAPR